MLHPVNGRGRNSGKRVVRNKKSQLVGVGTFYFYLGYKTVGSMP
jgi:hypothetical protein